MNDSVLGLYCVAGFSVTFDNITVTVQHLLLSLLVFKMFRFERHCLTLLKKCCKASAYR